MHVVVFSCAVLCCVLPGGRGGGLDRDDRYGDRLERGVGRDEGGFGPGR